MLLSDEVAEIARAMGAKDKRRDVLARAVVRLKAWEIHTGQRAPAVPEPEPGTVTTTCGLCGNEGLRYTGTCPECGGKW